MQTAIPGSSAAPEQQVNRSLAELASKAEVAGLKAGDFDETVHDLANNIAADINNAGMADQIRYLIRGWGIEAAAREIDRLAEEKAKPQKETEHGETTAPQP